MLKHLLRMMPKAMDLMSSITRTHKRRKEQNRWKKEMTVSVLELESEIFTKNKQKIVGRSLKGIWE